MFNFPTDNIFWWISQIFAFIGLVFVIISFQQKSAKLLLIFRNIATFFVLLGLCFLGNISAIIMCGVGALRNIISLYFAYKPAKKEWVKYIACFILFAILVTLNIVFWVNWMGYISILLGGAGIVAYMQSNAKKIRFVSAFVEIIAITYYSILLSPINVIIEVFAFISILVGIIRLDLKKKAIKTEQEKTEE